MEERIINISPEIQDCLPPITDGEYQRLAKLILQDGEIYEPLIVWKERNVLIDGHARWRCIQEHRELLKDKYTIKYVSFKTTYEAMVWRMEHMVANRQLTKGQMVYLACRINGSDNGFTDWLKAKYMQQEPNESKRATAQKSMQFGGRKYVSAADMLKNM